MVTKKRIYIVLISVFVLNCCLWFFLGRHNTILLSGDQIKDHQSNYSNSLTSLTISNHERGDELPWYYSLYVDYESPRQERLAENIEEQGFPIKKIGLIEQPDFENPEFSFNIISGLPLYSKVTTKILIGSGSTVYEGYYIYFFGWHRIIIHSRGIS